MNNKRHSHIHQSGDGFPKRTVFLNGKKVEKVFFADTKRGIVRAYRQPLKLDKWKKRLLHVTLRGRVEVIFSE